MRRRTRQKLVGLGVGAAVAVAGLAGMTVTGTEVPAPVAAAGEAEVPTALAAHLEQARRAVPGLGPSREGPGTAEDAKYRARAYPAEAIPLAAYQGAETAYRATEQRGAALEAGQARTTAAPAPRWTMVGPSRALYPFTEFRTSGNYVPNRYVAGGRTTSIALSTRCRPGACRAWITPAGGGVWRTEDAYSTNPRWRALGGPLGINAAGTVSVDPNDRSGNTIYLGTGEANTCASGCVAGVGLYRSRDGGNTWQGPLGRDVLSGKGIGAVVVEPGAPRTLYVGTTTALRGYSSVCCSGITRPVPGAAKWGLYKSTDGGATWRFVHNGARRADRCTGSDTEYANNGDCSPRGVREVALDPSDPRVVYASSYARGIWRSTDRGATWTQIKESLNPLLPQTRAAMGLTTLPNGRTRMYVYEGNIGDPYSRLFRSDDVRVARPTFRDLTSAEPADPGYATYNQCTAQCWYDMFVHTPPGHPDVVYTGGSYVYGETGGISNARGVVLSTDAGVSGTDMTMDGTDPVHPNGLHPDQHDLVTLPGQPFRFLETNDGGVMASDGRFANRSAWCDDRDLEGDELTRCRQLLSRVPARLDGRNEGLSTLQFQSLSVSPHDPDLLQGGTQDNGTWQTNGDRTTWRNTIIGDGGQSGFDAEDPSFRFHTYTGTQVEVNFSDGAYGDWIYVGNPVDGVAGTEFYAPVISDPRVSGTMFAGSGLTVHRTKTHGLGDRTLAEARRVCGTWDGTFAEQCGDWEPLGATALTATGWGTRAGSSVTAVERTEADTQTAWAGTTTGRVFVSRNVAAEPASAVRWTRVDLPTTPGRFVSSIHVDRTDPNRAWVSYSGFESLTPGTPGHVFQVVFDPRRGTARWTDLSYDLRDLPVSDLVRDDVTGDLYASTDFGVVRLRAGTRTWVSAAPGMPNVEVPGLTVDPERRALYAASHGRSAWRLELPR